MKKLLLISVILTILIGCSSEKVNFSQLQDRNGMLYLVNSEKPFSGDIVSYTNGILDFDGKVSKGLRDATWTYYYPSGQKKMTGNYKEGLKDGTWTYWNVNGTQQGLEVYKFGKMISFQGTIPQEAMPDSIKATSGQGGTTSGSNIAPASSAKKVEKKQQPVEYERLHGGAVKTLDGVPYTGAVVKHQKNGNKEFEGYFTDGKKSGKWTYYNKNGDVKDVKNY
ncbi:MAG: hypothetical protein ABSD71_12415 [Bacteroidales bacterium]|jgi:antitoxin component YwqK of YwqJK toxin-antitoxin module